MFLLSTHLFFIFVSPFSIWFFLSLPFFSLCVAFRLDMPHVTAPSIDWFCIFNDSRWFIIIRLCLTAFRNLTLVAKLPTFMFLLCFLFSFPASYTCFLISLPFSVVLLSKPQDTSLVHISLDWFCIFNYTLFSSDCFTTQPRWNDDDVYGGHDTCHDSLTWPILHGFYESVGLPKAPVNRSGEGVMLKMALVVVNALKAPESESLWNQEAGLQICGFNLWACLAVTYRDAQQVLPPDCSRKLGGTVILYKVLKLFLSLNCFNVDHLLLNFSQPRLVISLWQNLVTAPFILTQYEGSQSYSNLK